jgi:hypothetical protein
MDCTRFSISRIGSGSDSLLQRRDPGRLLSVHTNGLYCIWPDRAVLLLCPDRCGWIPFGLGCADFPLWKQCSGRVLSRAEEHLVSIGGWVFDYTHAEREKIFICDADTACLKTGVSTTFEIIREYWPESIAAAFAACRDSLFLHNAELPDFDDVWWTEIGKRLQKLLTYIHSRQENGTESFASLRALFRNLLGLGPGLTPLADDILCGFWAALSVLHGIYTRNAALASVLHTARQCMADGLESTTPQGRFFVSGASQGRHFSLIDDVFRSWMEDSPASVRAATAKLMNVGHSSGAGMLLGVLCAVELIVRATAGHLS